MSINHFSVIDNESEDVASNLTEKCQTCYSQTEHKGKVIDCPLYLTKRRNGKINNSNGVTFLCCAKTKTTKLFKEKLDALAYAYHDLKIPIESIKTNLKVSEQKRVNRLVHNLTTINGKTIQEVYDLVPQEVLTSDFNSQIPKITEIIKANPKDTALMFLRLAKHNIHMKSEFSIYKKLDRANPSIEKRNHPIHKVLMNVLHSFFVDFSDKEVYVNVGECRSSVYCDYETLQVALYHLIENASKYVKPKSTIDILFNEKDNTINVHFKMTSLYIEEKEYPKLFIEGFSGSEAKKTYKDGEGIGMWRIKQMLELNDFTIEVNPGKIIENLNGFRFSDNEFIIGLKKY
ncbi:histidine kinase [Flavobacteriales bacterium 34_180_T64]|nr:histidine kinase [Flavobacteriales bacterium 34_180_T64]